MLPSFSLPSPNTNHINSYTTILLALNIRSYSLGIVELSNLFYMNSYFYVPSKDISFYISLLVFVIAYLPSYISSHHSAVLSLPSTYPPPSASVCHRIPLLFFLSLLPILLPLLLYVLASLYCSFSSFYLSLCLCFYMSSHPSADLSLSLLPILLPLLFFLSPFYLSFCLCCSSLSLLPILVHLLLYVLASLW